MGTSVESAVGGVVARMTVIGGHGMPKRPKAFADSVDEGRQVSGATSSKAKGEAAAMFELEGGDQKPTRPWLLIRSMDPWW